MPIAVVTGANRGIGSEWVNQLLENGWTVNNLCGPPGSYGICTPNIYHRASCPKPGTTPEAFSTTI